MKSTEGQQILGVDHLRAVAAILVLFFHGIHQLGVGTETVPTNLILSLLEEGWVGVSLFITITGFMFTVLTNEREIEYFPFLRNRFLRIFPIMFIVTLFAASINDQIPETALLTFFNLLGGGVVFGTWTLVIELQFYLAYPFVRDSLTAGSIQRIILRCLSLVAVFAFFRIAFYAQKGEVQTLAYGTMFGHLDEFVAGILAGLVYLKLRGHKSIYTWLSFGLCLSATLYLQHWLNKTGGFYHRPTYPSPSRLWIVLPTISATLFGFLICTYCLVSHGWSGKASRTAAYLGSISYSIYMLHFITLPMSTSLWKASIALTFSQDLLIHSTILLLVWHIPITVLISALSYEMIEKAFLKRRVSYLGLNAAIVSRDR